MPSDEWNDDKTLAYSTDKQGNVICQPVTMRYYDVARR
jgi:hypothetical protein